jgi:hypothetical protein
MLNYTSVLKDFALDNKGLYALFIATMLTHPLEKIAFPHIFSKTLAAIFGYRKVRTLQESCDYHRFMDSHSSDFHEYGLLDSDGS